MTTAKCGFPEGAGALYRFGPTLWVQVGFDVSFHPVREPFPILPLTLRPALVDTGAMDCCIDSALAVELGLPVFDRGPISGVNGSFDANLHLAQMYIPALEWVMWGSFAAVHLSVGGQPHQMLIGRNLLRDFRMVYDGRTGAVTLARPN